jgi:deoxyribodipyrimidine photolyase-related protein
MPGLARANQLDAERDLPDCYWTGETDMHCLRNAVQGVRRRGYAHHIERLMILSNFALLYGVEPAQLNRWFHAGFVDAYHWVTTPNVVEMGLYGAGVFASKPYAASANYVNRMSDFCADCRYDHRVTTGENACPFNALYWDFLDRNEEQLRQSGRMGLVYSHLDDKEEDELAAIRERAGEVRRRGRESDL